MARSRGFALALMLAVGFQASVVLAADATGTWKWERTRNDQTFTTVLALKADGSKLTGSYESRRGGSVKIENGKIDGDKISFQVTREFNGNEFVIKYHGKVSAGRIVGEIEFPTRDGDTRTREWEAERVVGPADVVGTWMLHVETDEGQVYEPTLTISKDGSKLAAVYTSRDRETTVKEITVKDGKLHFAIKGENDNGDGYSIVFNGTPTGNTIKGKVDYDFNDNTGTLDFTGRRKVAPSVAGTWTWERSRGDRTFSRKLTLAVENGKLVGTYDGGRGDPVKIGKGTIDGNTIAFQVTREFNGNTRVTKYKGKISQGRIIGTRESERNGETRTTEWEAKRSSD